MEVAQIFLSLGSNLGDRKKSLEQGLDRIAKEIGRITLRSSLYETEPWGFHSGNKFLNLAVGVETRLTPGSVMKKILEIEKGLGRSRSGKGYHSRTLDIDILFYDDRVVEEEGLKIPHPKLASRRFVLAPLAEIAPGFRHPVTGRSIRELLETCDDPCGVKIIPDSSGVG